MNFCAADAEGMSQVVTAFVDLVTVLGSAPLFTSENQLPAAVGRVNLPRSYIQDIRRPKGRDPFAMRYFEAARIT